MMATDENITTASEAIYESWASTCLTESDNTKSKSSLVTEIQTEARNYFESFQNENDEGGSRMSSSSSSSRSSSNELAKLIAKLGPALSSKTSCKHFALTFFLGALQGVQREKEVGGDNDDKYDGLPLKIMILMSNFLLEHCGPISVSIPPQSMLVDANDLNDHSNNNSTAIDSEEDTESSLEDVRDTALSCIAALLATRIQISDNANDDDDLDQRLQFRCHVAQKAVQKRCASIDDCHEFSDDDDEEYDDDGDEYEAAGPSEREVKTLSGLSLLPRAKRSACFKTLEAAVRGMKIDLKIASGAGDIDSATVSHPTVKQLVDFISFASSCLFGETDPRCLMQMLHLLKLIQLILAPIIEESNQKNDGQEVKFPHTIIFDAVAPYYPVRFTPPPNDPHGITREGINSVLMDVLCHFISLTQNSTNDRPESIVSDKDTNMIILAAGLFLERLSPPVPYDPYGEIDDDDDALQDVTTVRDRIDALGDLSSLLLAANDQKKQQDILAMLNVPVVRDMSNILARCHEEAAASVATSKGEDEKQENKQLADSCRKFVTEIAYQFELQKRRMEFRDEKTLKSLWDTFVFDKIQDLAGIIVSSPQSLKGRMSIAYLASLSASGGEKTLRLCLDTCIPRLLSFVVDENKGSERGNRDEEKISTAIYGISVLFSSCRLSMEHISKDGIEVYPHPLHKYGSSTMQVLCYIINTKDEDSNKKDLSDLQVAAVKALESVLQSTPPSILSTEDTIYVRDVVIQIAQKILDDITDEGVHTGEEDESKEEWKDACARIVGCSLGRAMKTSKGVDVNTTLIESDPEIASFVESSIFPKVLQSSVSSGPSCDKKKRSCMRHDWMILSYACETDQEHTAIEIVSELYKKLAEIIGKSSVTDMALEASTVAEALTYVIRNGGPASFAAFHSIPRDEAKLSLIQLLTTKSMSFNSDNDQAMEETRMSTLMLPETRELYRSEADRAIKLSHCILPHLLPFYQEGVPERIVNDVISRASQVLPPLSDWDGAELCTVLPILSVILSSDVILSEELKKLLTGIISDLSHYALSGESNTTTRSAAASCVFSIIAKHQDNNSEHCLGMELLKIHVCPVIKSNMERQPQDDIRDLEDALNFAALVGSAAACRGRVSSFTADEVARFLALISCEGAANAPTIGIVTPLDCSGETPSKQDIKISTMAGAALGSMLNIRGGSPFVRQRLAHLVLPIILSSQRQICGLTSTECGRLICASHIICNTSVAAISQQRLSDLMSIIVTGVERCIEIICDKNGNPLVETKTIACLMTLMTGSLLKVYEIVPSTLIPHLGVIVPSLLLTNIAFTENNTAALSLLSLQFLAMLAGSDHDGVAYFCKAYKEKVVNNLAKSLDHQSIQIRQAAVEVINTWSVLGF